MLVYTVRKRVKSWGDEAIVAHTIATGERKVLLHDAADGQRFYVRLMRPTPLRPPVTHIDLVLNWVDEMKEKLKGSGR